MPVYSFLDKFSLAGKTDYPFVTHEDSGISGIPQKLAKAYPGAKVNDGFALRGKVAQNELQKAEQAVKTWLKFKFFDGK